MTVPHAADLREARQVAGLSPMVPREILEGFDGNIYANLVAVLKAVGNRLGGGVDPYRHPFDEVRFDAFG